MTYSHKYKYNKTLMMGMVIIKVVMNMVMMELAIYWA